MAESPKQETARRLRALAEEIERQNLPPHQLAQAGAMLKTLEKLLASQPREEREAPQPAPAKRKAAPPSSPVRVWSDGSCAPNPGPGGWAAIIERDGRREEISGAAPRGTNNIMEMTAALEGLRRAPPGAQVTVITDSEYVVKGMTQWLPGWKRKGWRTSTNGAVKNRELWEALDRLASERSVRWEWVAGHAGHPENERCDRLANAAREQLTAARRR
jgi:ribonuclease HI